jgi:hypothetical protein
MPKVNIEGPYRVSFYSSDCAEPPHVHVQRDREEAKIWLEPLEVVWNHGYSSHELRKVTRIVEDNHAKIMRKWDEHCGDYQPR